MKRDVRELLRKLQLLITVSLAVYPLSWLGAAWLGGELIGYSWLFSLGVVLFGFLALTVPGKLRLAYAVAISLIVLAGCIFLLPGAILTDGIVQVLLFAVQLFMCLKIAGWDRTGEISGVTLGFGIVTHLIGQILLLTDWAAAYPGWILRLSLYGYAVFAMLSVNRRTLVTAYGKWGRVPLSLGRRNAILVVCMFAIALLGGLIPSAFALFRDAVTDALKWIGAYVASLLSKMNGSASATAGDGSVGLAAPAVDSKPMELPPVMEKIALVVGIILSVSLVLFVLWRILKKLVSAVRNGWELFGKFLSGASEDYVDEVSDTRETGAEEHSLRQRRRRIRYRDDPNLPPEEQIRSRYRYMKYRHPEWNPGATAREKLPESAASIYERTRYSGHAPTQEDAQRFKNTLQDLS